MKHPGAEVRKSASLGTVYPSQKQLASCMWIAAPSVIF